MLYILLYTLIYYIFYIIFYYIDFLKAIGKKALGEQNRLPNKLVSQLKTTVENNVDKRVTKASIILKARPETRVKPIVKKEEEKKNNENKVDVSQKTVNIRSSLDSEKSESSLYVSALEDVTESVKNSLKFVNVSNTISSVPLCILFEKKNKST